MNDENGILMLAALLLVVIVIFAAVGRWIGSLGEKQNDGLGALLGGLLGPLGWILVAVLPARAAGDPEERRRLEEESGDFKVVMIGLGIAIAVPAVGIVWMLLL